MEEDGRRQEIRNFARENELPLTLALLIDTSPSVRPVFDEEKTTASAFLESVMRPKDLALVIGFDRCGHAGSGLHGEHRVTKARH